MEVSGQEFKKYDQTLIQDGRKITLKDISFMTDRDTRIPFNIGFFMDKNQNI